MPTYPRPLGRTARRIVTDSDMCLASAFAKLRELSDTPDMLIVERRQIVLEIKLEISEARRLLIEALGLRE